MTRVNSNIRQYWPTPKRRSLAASSDLRLFYEAMVFIDNFRLVSKKQLKDQMSSRVKGLKLIKHLSDTGTENLIKELKSFGWIIADRPTFEKSEIGVYKLTNEGIQVLKTYKRNKRDFLNLLIQKMHMEYAIPGWFIDRLWRLNPNGQGQIIIPTPLKKWNPKSRNWSNNSWDNELRKQVVLSYDTIITLDRNSFPINRDIWLNSVQEAWDRMSYLKKRNDVDTPKFAPKSRLTLAMKEAAIGLLFGNVLPLSEENDFGSNKAPLAPRSYMAWCPRLEELELIFYTDYNPSIPGRLIVPVSVFKQNSKLVDNEFINGITNLKGDTLALHRPNWNSFRKLFTETLYRVYTNWFLKSKSLYVSIQNVRDEVCRQLRISSSCFEELLSKAIEDSLHREIHMTISIETDVREDQRQQLERRPVNLNGKFCSLIAITTQIKRRNNE